MTTESESKFDATRTSHAHTRLLRSGDVLANRYRIEDTIGVGAMGTVYRAHDTRLELTVALKILHASIAKDADSITRFETELKLARQISHPNVVRIHDIGEHESLSFLSMDLIPGKALDDILNTDGKLDPERAAKIASGVARGLAAAHAQLVTHRDLKPANILVDENDNAVITDFGVARSAVSARLTQTGYFVGTPDYLAPEQARGGDIDGRADIYALGLILYEMLNGAAPFSGHSMEELVAQRTLGRQPNLARTTFIAPEYMRSIIKKCLQKSPDDRYQTASEIADNLDAHVAPGKNLKPLGKWAFLAAAIVGGVLLINHFADRIKHAEPPVAIIATTAAPQTIAILPFLEEPPDSALAWVSTTAYESLAIELDALSTLNVLDKQRVADTMRDLRLHKGPPTPQIADQLLNLFGADWLITATIRNANNRIIVDTSMIRSSSSSATDQIQQTTVDISQVNSIGPQIATAIRKTLSLPEPEWEPARLSNNMDALRAYATGVEALAKGDSIQAVPALQQATKLDENFAAAWLQLANAYERTGRESDATLANEQAIEKSGNDQSIASLARVKQAALAGDFELAKSVLEQKLSTRPSDTTTQLMLAELNGDQGYYQPAIEMLLTIVKNDLNHPRAWYLLGKFSIQNGDSQSALSNYLVNALKIQNQHSNPQGQADVLNAMGIAHHRVGQLEEAGESYEKAAAIRESIGDFRGLGSSLGNLARLELQLGRYQKARETLEHAIKVRSDLQDMSGLAGMYTIYGVLEEEVGNYRTALKRYRQALKIRQDRDDQFAIGNSYNNVGFSYFMLGEYDNASVYWQRALEQSVKISNPDAEMQAQQGLGQLKLAEGDWAKASELFLQSLETSRDLGFPDAEAVALGNLGRVAHHTGRYAAAISSYTDSLAILESLSDSRGVIEFLIWRAETWLNAGAFERATDDIDRALAMLQEHSRNEQLAYAHTVKAVLLAIANDQSGSAQNFALAAESAVKVGSDTPMLYLGVNQRMYQKNAPKDITELLESARDIGNASLFMRAMLIKANFEFEDGEVARASNTMTELLLFLNNHSPYFEAWKIYHLANRIFVASADTAQAKKEQQALIKETKRLLKEVPADVRDKLSGVFEAAGVLVK